MDGWNMINIFSFVIGFLIGVVVVAIAIEFGGKKTTGTSPTSRYTKTWSFSEIPNAKIMAEHLGEIEIPKGSKILVKNYLNKDMLKDHDIREYGGIKGNFIVGEDRVLVLSGPIKKDEIGIWTVEKEIVEKLNYEFDELWSKATRLE
jgi:hypothetical protein